jgi:protein-tyrosine phosphatase
VIAVAAREPHARPWKRAATWLLFLGPFFYLTYGAANYLAAGRADVGSVVFDWERQIPFIAWSIVPYWTINVFYAASLFVCGSVRELDTHARRLLTAQLVAVTCFLAFPLRFTFDKPEIGGGLPGFLFAALDGFDKPFNQAPSLHIALVVILWVLYRRHLSHWGLPRWACVPLDLWFVVIGASVLTTFQHHFVDIPTGALLGVFCLWLWPDRGPSPLAGAALTRDRRRLSLAGRYAGVAVLLATVSFWSGGAALWLLYPAISLALVALNYAILGVAGFQKGADGRMSLAARLLLAPYLAGAWINSRAWTRRDPLPVPIADGVLLGRIPSRFDGPAPRVRALVDLSAELPSPSFGGRVLAFPALDLVPPPPQVLRDAAEAIERIHAGGGVLVCCALGYSRSAAAVATWLVRSGAAPSVEAAVAMIRARRPQIVLSAATLDAVAAAAVLP